MKVLHVHSGNLFGGVERMLETLAPATAGRAPIASSYALCFEGLVADTLRAAGAEVHDLGPVHARRFDEVRRGRLALRSLLGTRRWDAALVHSAWSQAIFGPAVLESGTPLVRWLHAPQPGPRWLEYWSARARPALVVCNSRYTQEGVGARFGSVPVAVQYPPAVTRPSDAATRARLRADPGSGPDRGAAKSGPDPAELGSGAAEPGSGPDRGAAKSGPDPAESGPGAVEVGSGPGVVFVLAARLEAGKGHRLFIDALAQLPNGGWEAWIVGGAQEPAGQAYLDGLRHHADASGIAGSVRFLGQRNDVPALLAAADVYCQPNLDADSFGLSFVEALAAGLPVITTRLGAAPEIIDHTCGVLLEPGSTPALTDALRRMIDHPDERHRMSAAARTRAEPFCDLPRSLEHLAALLARAAAVSPALT